MGKNELTSSFSDAVVNVQESLIANADELNIVTHQDSNLFPLTHTFADGIYVRQMFMGKDTVVIGAIHNHEHVWFLLAGEITIASDEDSGTYVGPCYLVANPGTKRVIYANEDSVFVNVHKNPTNTKDIGELEREIVSATVEDYEIYKQRNK